MNWEQENKNGNRKEETARMHPPRLDVPFTDTSLVDFQVLYIMQQACSLPGSQFSVRSCVLPLHSVSSFVALAQ